MNIEENIKSYTIKGKSKESWLDNVPTKAVKAFVLNNVEPNKPSNIVLGRYIVGSTKTIDRYTLFDNGRAIYDLLPFSVVESKDYGMSTELSDLTKAWIIEVGQYNEGKIINGKTYYETAAEYIINTFDVEDEEIQDFVDSLELANIL